MTTYHNQGDPVGRRHPINPMGPSLSSGRRTGALPVALALLGILGAAYALFGVDTDPRKTDVAEYTAQGR
jgi:hypothetical protein